MVLLVLRLMRRARKAAPAADLNPVIKQVRYFLHVKLFTEDKVASFLISSLNSCYLLAAIGRCVCWIFIMRTGSCITLNTEGELGESETLQNESLRSTQSSNLRA